jgi:hypothetical protein
MVNFRFDVVRHLLFELGILIPTSHQNMRVIEAAGGYDTPEARDSAKVKETIKQAAETANWASKMAANLFAPLKCGHIDTAVRRLGAWADKPHDHWASELNTRSRALRDAIETELKEHLYYQYPKQRGEKLRNWDQEWLNSLASFPEIKIDVFSAVDCYALQHHTASVFHSMRVAEIGLRALAFERQVRLPKNKPLEWGTWQDILKGLDKEIAVIAQKPAGAKKDTALAFYSGAHADLNGFKDEYRNLVMHVRSNYDEHQALRALTYVHGFMERIAVKIDQSHRRISWGRF